MNKLKKIGATLVLGAALLALLFVLPASPPPVSCQSVAATPTSDQLILTAAEFAEWHDRLTDVGVIDPRQFPKEQTARAELNLLWALGLASQNPILETGEMMDPRYGGPAGFASTGGWTLGQGEPMDHYSRHQFFDLSPEEQALVARMAKGIYRPCCGNSTHFPDCNHGMAMLGLLQLGVARGASEEEMWQEALAANTAWFPDTYRTIAAFQQARGVDWAAVAPREVLGADYSSAAGYAAIAAQVTLPEASPSGGGCSA
jgi:hypothetical protein